MFQAARENHAREATITSAEYNSEEMELCLLYTSESSYEPTGPFGAKSIGEIVINTPSPAIANAIYNATHVRLRELPMTAEKIYRGMQELAEENAQ